MKTPVAAKTNAATHSATPTQLRTYPQAALTHRRSAKQVDRLLMSAGKIMADHIAAAQRYRARAAKCELSAKNTSSAEFGECYRLLAQHYLVLANLEEDCAHRQSPFAPAGRQQSRRASAGPLGRRADVCSAAIANGRPLGGDRIDAADGGCRHTGR